MFNEVWLRSAIIRRPSEESPYLFTGLHLNGKYVEGGLLRKYNKPKSYSGNVEVGLRLPAKDKPTNSLYTNMFLKTEGSWQLPYKGMYVFWKKMPGKNLVVNITGTNSIYSNTSNDDNEEDEKHDFKTELDEYGDRIAS